MNTNDNYLSSFKKPLFFIIAISILLTRVYSFLLFHTIIELIGISLSIIIVFLSLLSYKYIHNNMLLLFGTLHLCLAILDLIHTLAYKEMGIFIEFNSNLPTQFWIAGRYLQSLGFLTVLISHQINIKPLFFHSFYILYTILIFFLIFQFKIYPDCFIEGDGLTTFKIFSEYIIITIFLITLIVFYKFQESFDMILDKCFHTAIILLLTAEFMFTLYDDVFGTFNYIGHVLRFLSYYPLYKCFIKEQLHKPYKEAIEANKIKNDFLANMSHELRTPLNSILGFSQILIDNLKAKISDEELEFLIDIEENGKSLLGMINQVLDISKIEAGKVSCFFESFSLNSFIKKIIEKLKIMLENKNLTLLFDMDEEITIISDKNILNSIITNLLHNSIKFTPHGGKIEIICKVLKERVRISVNDNGIGIDKKNMIKLFEKFSTFSDIHTREFKGMGIGLYLVKKFVNQLGGEIQVSSEPHVKTSFTFFLPPRDEKFNEKGQKRFVIANN